MGENDRVSVQTYVPEAQRDVWRAEAEEMDMSQAEFVRSMVQAGRRSFDLGDDVDTGGTNAGEAPSPALEPGGNGLKDRILDIIEHEGAAGWDELRAGVTDDIDERLDNALSELQDEGRVRHSGRRDGYVVVEDGS